MSNELEDWLTQQARALNLTPLSVEEAEPETVRAYCREVLNELAARGRLPGAQMPGCYAAPRQTEN
ncbi:hypothetical protein MF271_12670 [Deinococcus sp. KNUC1210]|uniref:hypothetical protein n=1 Tax=Deinococcus sp. KNUC1210 TaxID=2917691 RepID=UPI001EEFDCD4|nr:hypothetical protein [Deinococcus sp. KNUC1210]ULH14828.1 hypothetical protein MF271_12670 [Deinococcus sp. KNUC1210]